MIGSSAGIEGGYAAAHPFRAVPTIATIALRTSSAVATGPGNASRVARGPALVFTARSKPYRSTDVIVTLSASGIFASTRAYAMSAREMKLEGESRVREGGASVVLGALRTRAVTLSFVAVLRAPSGPAEEKALARGIAAEAFPAHVVLVVPKGRAWGSGLLEVEFDGLVRGGTSLVERSVTLARLEDDVDPCRLTDAVLVVHRKTRRVWFHETPMELADSGYAMVEGLALREGRVTSGREVCGCERWARVCLPLGLIG